MSEYWEYVSSPLQLLVPSSVVPSSLLSLVDVSSVLSNEQLASLSGGLLTEGADLLCLILGLLAVLLLSYLLLPRLIRLISKTKAKLPSLPSCCSSGWSGGCGALARVRSALGRLGKLISCCEQVPAAPKPPKLVRLSTTFTISNFLAADLLLEKESYLESAVFSAAGHPKERFQLRVHPRAGKNGDEVSLFLRYVPVVETIAPPKGGGGVVAAAVESLEASAASLDVSGSSSSTSAAATPAATAAAPVTKVATVHFVCRIGTPKELKAQIKAGEGAGWVNFISREELLRVLDAKKTTNLTIQLQGHLVV
ncbi:hypothetical protein TYRP_016265 [Tyrophagus putrescentiae]|nr:hypothetical protein TYRP_016265 [Tyrophagus putrescentiae]